MKKTVGTGAICTNYYNIGLSRQNIPIVFYSLSITVGPACMLETY